MRDFLGDNRHIDDAAAGAAVVLGERQRQQAGLDPGLIELFGIAALAIMPAHCVGRRMLRHQLAHAVAQQPLFFGEPEIHEHSIPKRPPTTRLSGNEAQAAEYNPEIEASDQISADQRIALLRGDQERRANAGGHFMDSLRACSAPAF